MPRKPKQPAQPTPAPAEPAPKRARNATSRPSHATVDPLISGFRAHYPFPLDPFQEEAIAHLVADESVMVAAPTGTGKTVVAEFGVFRMVKKGLRVMYTTPIKALSNQKFRDLRDQYGADKVGLL